MVEFPKDFSQHKQIKKRLIAPFNAAMGNIVKTSTWHLERMPELIWIAEIIAALGPKTSFDILCQIVGYGLELPTLSESRIAPFMASFWKEHSEHTSNIAKQLPKKDAQLVSNALYQFASLYPEYPTNWLVGTVEMSHTDQYLIQFKKRLSQLLNRFSRLSMMTQAHSFLCLCRLG